MAEKRYSVCTTKCAFTTTATNLLSVVSHVVHCNVCVDILLPLRHSIVLATFDSLHDILHVVDGFDFGDTEPPIRFFALIACMVFVCILLPSTVT